MDLTHVGFYCTNLFDNIAQGLLRTQAWEAGALPRRLKGKVARAPLFEVRGVRFTHSPYWHTSVTLTPLNLTPIRVTAPM